jgi:histidinol phosphatase-like enzyme
MLKQILICIDKDGTIVYDKRYHLGHQPNWKSKVKLLDNVVKGIRKLNKLNNTKIYIATNQPGVAIKDLKLLTKEKAELVCQFIIERLEKQNAIVNGYEVCGKVSPKYIKEKKQQGKTYKFDKKLTGNFSCIKPKPGMVYSIMKKENLPANTKIYFLGDRASDVKTSINAKGFGILIPFPNRPDEIEKTKKLKSTKKYIAKDFMDACNFIIKREK